MMMMMMMMMTQLHVLPTGIGRVEIRSDVSEATIRSALASCA